MAVLVLAAETDRTADSVITGLTEQNVPVIRVDMSWFPQQMSIEAEFRDGACTGAIQRILPAYATADLLNVVNYCRAAPVAVDVVSDGGNIDPAKVGEAISSRASADGRNAAITRRRFLRFSG